MSGLAGEFFDWDRILSCVGRGGIPTEWRIEKRIRKASTESVEAASRLIARGLSLPRLSNQVWEKKKTPPERSFPSGGRD
jgi:hypothetical protein